MAKKNGPLLEFVETAGYRSIVGWREWYLYWEDADSMNNVTWVQHMVEEEDGRPSLFQKASTYLQSRMKMIRLFPAEDGIENWDQLPLFSGDGDLRLVWKPGLNWRAIVDEIEAHPEPWPGPRPPDAQERAEEAWDALSPEEQNEEIARIVDALDAQEKGLERSLWGGK